MKVIWKTSILIILTSFLLYLWSSNFTPLQQQVQAEGESSGSTIGGQEVDSLKKEEIISLLNKKILEWKQNSTVLTGNNVEIEIEPEWFTFDVEASVTQYLNQVDTPWFAFWESPPTVHIPLQFSINPELTALIAENVQLNTDETLANITNQVGVLSTEPIETVALDFSMFESERIAFELENISFNTSGLTNIVSALNEQVIGSGEVFSLLDHLSDVNLGASNETVDFVASVLYSVILQTNFEVLERHSQGALPGYLQPGVEAKIRKNLNVDFKFVNKETVPAILKIQIKGTDLLIEIYSVPLDTEATYRLADKVEIKPRTIYRYSANLKVGEEQLLQEGKAGLRISVYRTISDKSGPFEKEELIDQDYYPPVNRVILKSSLVPAVPTVTDPDLNIDLNGDGLPDIETVPTTPNPSVEETNDEEQPEIDESTGLPEGSYYDKAGNIINPDSK
ncbi:VanW family protein [Psychrobacillus soli]|uniref:G5 domain-containing protein n=1 Tax=Psychrobacillus soli TaxID=1543965 RepID=A0A544TBS5_9BACI|nr:VanW family protein [Psychrobacillus soli]TQR14839.1 hypothetical protein FG383_10185 [Psychrobacillus soli]